MDRDEAPDHNVCKQQLYQVLKTLGIKEPREREAIDPHCALVSFDKGEMLHQSGDVASRVFFVCQGLVRLFYITPDGKEHNKSFSKENDFSGATQSIEKPLPSRFYLQAIEPTKAIAISLQGLSSLYHQSLPWANLGRLYMEALAVKKTNREAAFLLDSAEQRYRDFLVSDPELVPRLPLYHVASYLGITDVALSRIRKRMETPLI